MKSTAISITYILNDKEETVAVLISFSVSSSSLCRPYQDASKPSGAFYKAHRPSEDIIFAADDDGIYELFAYADRKIVLCLNTGSCGAPFAPTPRNLKQSGIYQEEERMQMIQVVSYLHTNAMEHMRKFFEEIRF